MQEKKDELLRAIAKVIKRNRGEYSISKLSLEIDLSKSVWSKVEQAKRDAQISTFCKVAEALNIKASNLLEQVETELGDKFSFIETT